MLFSHISYELHMVELLLAQNEVFLHRELKVNESAKIFSFLVLFFYHGEK